MWRHVWTGRLRQMRTMSASMEQRRPLVAIIGATGTGKSKLAVDLAKRFSGEIINGDAMQMYDGLPVITNKIPLAEREGVPHHLLGCVGLHEQPWRVGMFADHALGIIDEVQSRGKLPILVGGTHYYTQALLFQDSLARGSEGSEKEAVDGHASVDTAEKFPILNASTEELLAKLREVDPVMADRWHPNEHRKIRRSLEIYLTTGRRASEIYSEQSDEPSRKLARFPTLILWTHTPSEVLQERLNGRVEQMMTDGLVDEVESLETFPAEQDGQGAEVDRSRGIWVSIGYKEFGKYMEARRRGNVTATELERLKAEAIERTKIATRQYAKSQLKWIRIKLLNALRDADMLTRLFVLDTTTAAEEWDSTVLTPAEDLVRRFVTGESLPPATQGLDILSPRRDYDVSQRKDLWVRRTCDVCGVTAVLETEWEQHIRGRAHRRRKKAREKAEQSDRQSGRDKE